MFRKLLLLVSIFSTFCVAGHDDLKLTRHVQEVDSVNVMVDPRFELLSIVQLLSKYFLITRYEQQYKHDAISYFKKHQNHEAVKYFKVLSDKGFKFSYPAESVLYLNYDLTINNNLQIPNSVIPEGVSKKDVLKFHTLLRTFAKDSNFFNFYQSKHNCNLTRP